MATPSGQLKIVIVEDDKFLQKILATKFAKEGFEVRSAFDGEEALKTIAEVKPDILLLDLILPKLDRKSTRLNSSHSDRSRMPSSA